MSAETPQQDLAHIKIEPKPDAPDQLWGFDNWEDYWDLRDALNEMNRNLDSYDVANREIKEIAELVESFNVSLDVNSWDSLDSQIAQLAAEIDAKILDFVENWKEDVNTLSDKLAPLLTLENLNKFAPTKSDSWWGTLRTLVAWVFPDLAKYARGG